jgi:hypothetical protein
MAEPGDFAIAEKQALATRMNLSKSGSRKLQIPSTKLQRSTKLQAPNRRSSSDWSLVLGISLELGTFAP